MNASFAVLLTFFALTNALELPKFLETCRRSDPQYNKCLTRAMTTFVTSLSSGLESLKIPPVDPLVVGEIKIDGSKGPVALNQKYYNVKYSGNTEGISSYVRIDFDKLIMHAVTHVPRALLTGDYEVDGKVLILPIRGKGRANMTLTNLNTTHTIHLGKYVADGETYLRVTKYDLLFKTDKYTMYLDNLFDGEKALGEQINAFMNANSDLLFKEFAGHFEKAFGLVFKNIANKVFSRFPMKILFPE